jgi:hypothetical protein
MLVLSGLALIAAGTAIWFWRPPPKPTARIQLYSQSNPIYLLNRPDGQLSGDAFLRNQAYIIKDSFVLNAALNDPEVAKLALIKEKTDQLQWLENEITIDFPGPEFIQISLSGERPQELLAIVRAVRKAYVEKTGDKELADREATLGMLKAIQTEWEKRTKDNRRRLKQLQLESGAIDMNNLALAQKIAFEDLASTQKDLVKVRSEIRRLRVEIGLKPEWREAFWPQFVAVLNASPASISPLHPAVVGLLYDEFLIAGTHRRPLVSQAQLDNDPIAVELLKKIGKLKADVITVKASIPSEAAFQKDSASLRSALDFAQKELEKRHQEVRSQLEEDARVRARNEEQANRTRSPRERYAAALALERILAEAVQQLDEQTGRKNRMAVDLADIKDEIAKAEDIMNRASKKIDAIEIEQKAPPRVKEFGEGSIDTPSEAERNLWTIAPVSLVGLGVVFLAFAGVRFRALHPPGLLPADSHPATV